MLHTIFMRRVINVQIYKGDDGFYTATCLDFPVVTQGKTLDELEANLREALSLHFEGEDMNEHGFEKDPVVVASIELALTDASA